MNIEINRINTSAKTNLTEFIATSNEAYFYQLKKISEEIAKNKNEKPVILLSGPSGSGKTTTAFIIDKMLSDLGCPTHTLSMDNYFKSLTEEERLLSSTGKVDLESPNRIDTVLLNKQIKNIEKCVPVDVPKYDFSASVRRGIKLTLQRKKEEMVLFEGIHALNPDVITVPDNHIFKIYVSVRTRITGEDIILHPSKIRLMRRMIRDKNFRKRSLIETMNMFRSVEDGENKYIMPYKYRSDYDIDTFMPYEMSVYRELLLDDLHKMSNVPELNDVIKILDELNPINEKYIPKDSLIREFIGKGEFKY